MLHSNQYWLRLWKTILKCTKDDYQASAKTLKHFSKSWIMGDSVLHLINVPLISAMKQWNVREEKKESRVVITLNVMLDSHAWFLISFHLFLVANNWEEEGHPVLVMKIVNTTTYVVIIQKMMWKQIQPLAYKDGPKIIITGLVILRIKVFQILIKKEELGDNVQVV